MACKVIQWDSQEWRSVATEKQKFYYEFFRNRRWEHYEETEYTFLKLKVGYALFGPPVDVKNASLEEFYSSSKLKKIEDVFAAIKKASKRNADISLGIFFIVVWVNNEYTEFPAFRVLSYKLENGLECYKIVDARGYIHRNWATFVAATVSSYGTYCFPKDGFYTCNESGEVEVEFCQNSGYSLLSGVSYVVGAVATSLMSPRATSKSIESVQQNSTPIPCISVTKGVLGCNRKYWFPVTAINGSAEIYAIHSTRSVADSSQRVGVIPQIIADALEYGYIKINWYAVMNNIENTILHTEKTTNTHIAQVISTVLFFCHSVLTPDVTKMIIKEARNNIKSNAQITLNYKQKIAFKNSLKLLGKSSNSTATKNLKFIDDRMGVVNEIIEKHFKAQFMVPDQYGNYYMMGKLLDNLCSSSDTKKYANIITNYCLVLEETIRNCSGCSKIIEENSKFIETLNLKVDSILLEERESRKSQSPINNLDHTLKNEHTPKCSPSRLLKEKFISEKSKEKEFFPSPVGSWCSTIHSNFATPNPESIADIEKVKKSLTKEWLRRSVAHKSLKRSLCYDSSEGTTPKLAKIETSNIESEEGGSYLKTNTRTEYDNNGVEYNCLSNDFFTNVNTPIIKKHKKIFKIEKTTTLIVKKNTDTMGAFHSAENPRKTYEEISPCNMNETIRTISDIIEDSFSSICNKQKEVSLNDSNYIDAEENLTSSINSEEELNLSGKFVTFKRQIRSDEDLKPLDYFYTFVEDELKKCNPMFHMNNNNNYWQFIINEETCGVKLVKIEVARLSSDCEDIALTYF